MCKTVMLFLCVFCINYLHAQDSSSNISGLQSFEQVFEQWDDYFYEKSKSNNHDLTGTGYKQYLREKYQFLTHRTAGMTLSEGHRWEVFKEERVNNLNKTGRHLVSPWVSLGPNSIDSMGGRMISHAFDPVNPDIIWGGSASGGIWKSTNAGNSWFSITDDLPSMYVSDIEINPYDNSVILAGTGVDKYLSITINPGVGVLRSTDNGITWGETNYKYVVGQNISVSKMQWKPGSADSVYMAASNGIWVSGDGGINWNLMRSGRALTLAINPRSPQTVFAIFRNEGIFKSTDGGVTWLLLDRGVPSGSNIGFSSISLAVSNPQVLYACFSDPSTFASLGVYKTTDGGVNWFQLSSAPNAPCAPNQPNLCQGWFVNHISVSPFNENLVLYGGISFWRSGDGGTNWLQLDVYSAPTANYPGKTYVDVHDVGFNPADSNIVYVFNDGGVQKSKDKGIWWDKVNTGLVTAQIHRIASSATDTNLIIGGFQDHGLQKLSNAGGNQHWKRWSDNDGTNVIIDPQNNNIFYGDYFLGNHRKSTNGGASAQSTFAINHGITEGGALIAPLVMHPVNSSILYTSSTAKIYKSINAGSGWVPVAEIPNVYTMAIDQINPNIVYAHVYTNNSWSIWVSQNGGSNWTQISNASIPTWRVTDLEADPLVSGTVYAVRNSSLANQDHIKRSTDFGQTWVNITNNLPDIFVYAVTISPFDNQHIYLATELGVYVSTNGGNQWAAFNEGLPIVRTYDIHYNKLDRTVRIATIGRGVWKAKALDLLTGISESAENNINEFNLFQNYPNPFNSTTTFRYEVFANSSINIELYDPTGQKIDNIYNGTNAPGMYSIALVTFHDSQIHASGTYYLRFHVNNQTETMKIMYLK